ncbi:LOW QUALITY PROTEIN: CTD nuclear envelope phosphatase 1A-like [Brienomyrus brachyistius]|uniref:LOW QUALITY PROTEIN: CTD nuclear envelope phosphatase 1A-like n=1 Tax=Brienomyrus brachyistius TaxID=42636 RepID=UPI0020B2D8E5|nr:LOW QUALITY PROTEIN: CTD nuclear envelope phosphatase 1A-like [Brienomyrus brachyistius]
MRHRRTDLTPASQLTSQNSLLAWFSFGQANCIRLCGTLWWSCEGGPLWGLASRLCGIYFLSPLLRSVSLSLFYVVDMLKTRQCLLWIRTFLGVTSRIWGFILCVLRKHLRTIIQYQTVRYDLLPLSSISRNRLNAVKRKILVLDLDETLIHSHHDGVLRPSVRPGTPPDFILKVVIDKHPVRFFVHKRPHVDFFLEVVSQWYELVVFTASMEIYGSAVADRLDNNRSILKRRYYRQHCTLDLGSYIKDLSVVHSDLSSIVILDNSPGAYRGHPDNAIPIKSWFSDPSDTALLNLLPMLDALRFTADVRSVLSRNLHQHRLW